MTQETHKVEFTYKVSGVETKVNILGEVKPVRELIEPNGFLFEGRGVVDNKPFTEINFNGYLDPKCITDDIIDFMKKKLKEEHGKKVHFDYDK